MKKTITTMAALAAVLWLQAGSATAQTTTAQAQQKVKPKPVITYEAYQVDSLGYGYKIKMDDVYIIDQPFIPVIEGVYRFATDKQALKMAKLVAGKIDRGVYPPSVLSNEVDSLQIDRTILVSDK